MIMNDRRQRVSKLQGVALADVDKARVLLKGAVAALGQNAVFPADVRAATHWTSEAAQILGGNDGR